MKILITGAGGFIGHRTLSYLLKNTDWQFVVTDSFNHYGTSSRLRAIFNEMPEHRNRVKVISHDLNSPIDKVTAHEFGKINTIINIASLANVDDSIKNPGPFIQNNINIAINMLEYARSLDSLDMFIQFSTDEVYGDAPDKYSHIEWDQIIPSSPYSASKAAQEAIANSYWRTFNLPIIITNTMNVFGERQHHNAFIPRVINNLKNNKITQVHGKYVNNEFKKSSRHYTYVENQSDAIKFLIEYYKNIPIKYSDNLLKLEKFNISGTTEIYNDDVVTKIAKILNINNKELFEFVSPEIHRPGLDIRYALNGDKLKSLGWQHKFSFDESLEKTVKWFINNPEWL